MMIQEECMISMVRKGYRSKAHVAMEMCSPGTITNKYIMFCSCTTGIET